MSNNRVIHEKIFNLVDLQVKVRWRNEPSVEITFLRFKTEHTYPIDQVIDAENDGVPVVHDGLFQFRKFLEEGKKNGFVFLTDCLVVPWHQIVSIHIVNEIKDTLKLRWRWSD